MSLCHMGMALSTSQDKPRSIVARLRKKLGFGYHSSKHNGSATTTTTTTTTTTAPMAPAPPPPPPPPKDPEPPSPVSPLSTSSRRRNGAGGKFPVVPGLPRQQTMARAISERRENLREHRDERPRASSRSLQPIASHSMSEVGDPMSPNPPEAPEPPPSASEVMVQEHAGPRESELQIISASEDGLSDVSSDDGWHRPAAPNRDIEAEMEWRWILNISMHFRDESNREKFFVTYAQEMNLRRRLTISCDYRDAEEGTLERELASLRSQRDKAAKIYEAIRDSLQDILFYDTITNLKLQTADGRLHVHVTEDQNEVINFPPVIAIHHLQCPKYRESELDFDSHLSGFVYKVRVKGQIMIKKEIPGPDTVDEFLYEINALYALAKSENVIRFGGCIVDDRRERIKGLLIAFAPNGALIDVLFNDRGRLPWPQREKWAKQIVSGLSEIHEAGYVQGDFTLSNIVIDGDNNAKIIDINRRGCPVGWEPPEVTAMIDGLQRIGMYIGVKSDLFQLGMVLWAIAHESDEPENFPRPLAFAPDSPPDVPEWYREIVRACLSASPQSRPNAKDLVDLFPERIDDPPVVVGERSPAVGPDGFPWTTTTTAATTTREDDEDESVIGGVGIGSEISGVPTRRRRVPMEEEEEEGVYGNGVHDDDSQVNGVRDTDLDSRDGGSTPVQGVFVDAKEIQTPAPLTPT